MKDLRQRLIIVLNSFDLVSLLTCNPETLLSLPHPHVSILFVVPAKEKVLGHIACFGGVEEGKNGGCILRRLERKMLQEPVQVASEDSRVTVLDEEVVDLRRERSAVCRCRSLHRKVVDGGRGREPL